MTDSHDLPADPSSTDAARAKEAAGRHAASYVVDGMRVGLGTGSTVHFSILELGDRRLDIVCTATSKQTDELARSLGLRVVTPDEIGALDIAIDGADEVDPAFNLTKGGGGAHTREKLVAQMSPRFIVVVDESKLVPSLGPFGTPLEVLDFAPGVVASRVRALGARDLTTRDGRSDNGNLLVDAHFGPIADPDALGRELSAIPGIVEHGLFPAAMVERVVVAGAGGVRELVHPRP
ncbi:MAG: ribose-5-phosphate isomerase RpiA [Acidimicrobiales bacterium]